MFASSSGILVFLSGPANINIATWATYTKTSEHIETVTTNPNTRWDEVYYVPVYILLSDGLLAPCRYTLTAPTEACNFSAVEL
jgi:hypothetical protein